MLTYSQIAKKIKPCLVLNLSKIVLFFSIGILLIASGRVSLSPIDETVSDCSPYLNTKLSLYHKQIKRITFFMTVLGFIFSLINFVIFLVFYIQAKKKLTSKSDKNSQYKQNRLKFNFIIIFLESICLLNIFLRSVQQLRQFSTCNISSKTVSIVSIILSSLIIVIHAVNIWIFLKFLSSLNKKLETSQEFSFYSDRTSIRQNLIFNKIGYVKQLMKIQNFSSRSTSLRSQTIKGLPSGYKRQDFSPTRQIIYKLCGGNKEQFQRSSVGENANQRKISYQEQFNVEQELSSERKKSNDQKAKQISNDKNNISLLQVKPKLYTPSPNRQNLQQVTKTIDILQVALGKKQPPSRQQYESSVQEQQQQIGSNDKTKQQSLFNLNKVPNQRFKNDLVLKQKQKISKQLRQQEELKQKFNLTPNIQERRKYENVKNWQNIDQNGHYYQVNVQKIKTKTKLLDFKNLNDDSEQINPNLLYSKRQWVKRKKRVAKKHEKNVQEYLKNLSKIRKQEMLCQEDSSDQSQNFQPKQLSSQFEDSSSYEDEDQNLNLEINEKQQQNEENKENFIIQKPIEPKRKRKDRQPELYLHMRKRKHPTVENKLKLFQDEEGFYDDEYDLQSSEGNNNLRDEEEKEIQKIYQKGLGRQQSSQKQKQEQKIQYRNKQLQTQEAQMLKFIRNKYIESKYKRQHRKNERLGIVFEEQQQNSSVKQKR